MALAIFYAESAQNLLSCYRCLNLMQGQLFHETAVDRIRRRGLIWTISIFWENDFDPAAENPLLTLVAILWKNLL